MKSDNWKSRAVLLAALLTIGIAMAVASHWEKACYLKGRIDAKWNIEANNRIIYSYGLAEPKNDTELVADSLVYRVFGFEGRGAGCATSPSFEKYIDGYNSIYVPYLEKTIQPKAISDAKSILKKRRPNWKMELSEEQKKMRDLLRVEAE